MNVDQSVESVASDLFIVRCTSVATLTVLIYDYLCTLDDEIRLVWKSRLSFVKCIFLANRVIAFTAAFLGTELFLLNSDGDQCYSLALATSLTNLFIFITGEIILFMRVYAVWGGQRYTAIILGLFYIIGITGALYASVATTLSVEVAFSPELFGRGCLIGFTSDGFWICYLVLICHETVMLVLIVVRSITLNRHISSHTVDMLIKDGAFYYLCVLAMSIGNMLMLFLGPPQLRGFLLILQGVLHSILCAHLILRLRGIYHSLTTGGMHSLRIHLDAEANSLEPSEDHGEASIVLTSFSQAASAS